MEKLRQCLLESATTQSDFIEIFSAIDRDCSGRITIEEFRATIKSLELGIDKDEEIKDLFRQFDTTNNGRIDLYEFLRQLRLPMNDRRQKAALNFFQSVDVNHDGKLTILDLKTKYAAQLVPTKRRSSQSIDLALENFFKKFGTHSREAGVIDQEEFLSFCSILSATIKEDVYFEHVLRTLFHFRV